MLRVRDLSVDVGGLPILNQVSLEIPQGSVVGLLGPNGSGKTTLLMTVSGLLRRRAGTIELVGRRIDGMDPADIVRQGIGHVPQNRELFWDLSVKENLELGAVGVGKRNGLERRLDETFECFPVLRERARQTARTLSGGEQQMLAVGRALMGAPQLLMLDEPSGGLAPRLVAGVAELIRRLRGCGLTVLLVEQNVPMAFDVVDYVYVLVNGRIRVEGTIDEARRCWNLATLYLGGLSR